MFQLLFWNINGNSRATKPLQAIVRKFKVDIVVLAEAPPDQTEMADALTMNDGTKFTHQANGVNQRISVLSRESVVMGSVHGESNYAAVRSFRSNSGSELLLAAYHGISRLEDELVDLDEEACVASELIREVETDRGHQRTLLVGDMNLNPFDAGMAKARGFFGVMAMADAARERQRVKFNDYPLFYNPMWSRLGDTSVGPPGTYYRRPSSHLGYYWHTYDQVLLRPALLPAFRPDRLHVLTSAGKMTLLRDGKPDADSVSDHLPIVIGLDLDSL